MTEHHFTFVQLRKHITQWVDKQECKHEGKQSHSSAVHHSTAADRKSFQLDVCFVLHQGIWCWWSQWVWYYAI